MRILPFAILLASACLVAAARIEPSAAAANPGSGSAAKSAADDAGSYGYRRASGARAVDRRDLSAGAASPRFARRRRTGGTFRHSLQRRFAPALASGARSAVAGLKQAAGWMGKHPRTVATLAAVAAPTVKSMLARAGAAPDLLKVFGVLSAGLLLGAPVANGIEGSKKAYSNSAEKPSDEAIALAAEYILRQAQKKGDVPPSSFDPDRRPSDSDGLPTDPDLLPFPARKTSTEKATSEFPGRPLDDSGDPDQLPSPAREAPIENVTSRFAGRPFGDSGDPDLLPFSAREAPIESVTSGFPNRPFDDSSDPATLLRPGAFDRDGDLEKGFPSRPFDD